MSHSLPDETLRITYEPYSKGMALDTFRKLGESMDSKYSIDARLLPIIQELVKYMHGDGRFNGNLLNGIGVFGSVGTGKTTIFKIMQQYMAIDQVKWIRNGKVANFNFKIISARTIMADFGKDGFDAIENYIIPNVICIDDLGAENATVNHYGNKLNILTHILEERYMAKKITHFSTNMDYPTILTTYGERVHSRVMESTNNIKLIRKDFRTLNGIAFI